MPPGAHPEDGPLPGSAPSGHLHEPHAIVAARRAYIASIPDETERRHVRFFFDLDHATNPALMRENGAPPSPAYLAAFQHVFDGLARRIRRRASSGPDEALVLDPLRPDALEVLSSIQRTIYDRHFPVDANHADLQAAFEGFAAGRFYTPRFGEWDAAPRSAMILAFAEFSIACIEARRPAQVGTLAGVDRAFWAARLPVHLASARVYERATPLAAGERNLADFVSPRPELVPDEFLTEVRAEFADVTSVERLVSRHTGLCRAMLGA